MKTAAALLAIASIASSASSNERLCPKAMPATVEARLSPVLRALDRAHKRNDIWDKQYEAAFASLLRAKDKASVQARVALMDYYVGESYGEELVCAVALDGANSAEFLELYDACDIPPKHSPVPRAHTLPLRTYALKMVREGNAKEKLHIRMTANPSIEGTSNIRLRLLSAAPHVKR